MLRLSPLGRDGHQVCDSNSSAFQNKAKKALASAVTDCVKAIWSNIPDAKAIISAKKISKKQFLRCVINSIVNSFSLSYINSEEKLETFQGQLNAKAGTAYSAINNKCEYLIGNEVRAYFIAGIINEITKDAELFNILKKIFFGALDTLINGLLLQLKSVEDNNALCIIFSRLDTNKLKITSNNCRVQLIQKGTGYLIQNMIDALLDKTSREQPAAYDLLLCRYSGGIEAIKAELSREVSEHLRLQSLQMNNISSAIWEEALVLSRDSELTFLQGLLKQKISKVDPHGICKMHAYETKKSKLKVDEICPLKTYKTKTDETNKVLNILAENLDLFSKVIQIFEAILLPGQNTKLLTLLPEKLISAIDRKIYDAIDIREPQRYIQNGAVIVKPENPTECFLIALRQFYGISRQCPFKSSPFWGRSPNDENLPLRQFLLRNYAIRNLLYKVIGNINSSTQTNTYTQTQRTFS